ncbi:MAG: VOC family protein [Verrucomicrobiales bacterium]|nr:VOC family protein [Verrucomicrobiales bacterium]
MSTATLPKRRRFRRISPFLWYVSQAEEAANHYVSIFENSRVLSKTHYEEQGAKFTGRTPGSVMTVNFELDGQAFVALNGGPHDPFNDAISLSVSCRTQAEIDHYWDRLSEGGRIVQCGWLKDRFGVSWQIVPAELDRLLSLPDPSASVRVMKALYGMVKLDLAELRRAAKG